MKAMGKQEEFEVKIKGPGLQLDRKVDEETAKAILGIVLGVAVVQERHPEPRTPRLPADQTPRVPAQPIARPSDGTPELSIAEFLKDHDAVRNVDKIACFGAFLKHQRGQDTFKREDVVKLFEAAREKIPANLPRDLTWTAKIGWIATSSQSEDEYYLTRSGEEAVNKKFPEDLKEKTKVGGRPSKKSKSTTSKRTRSE